MTVSATLPDQPVLATRPDLTAIRLSGDEVRDFLNDILTAQIKTLDEATARPACLLTPQGRILFDMMVMVKTETVYLITQAEQAGPLAKRLMMYRLRRKIDISQPAEMQVGHLWGDGQAGVSVPEGASPEMTGGTLIWAALFCLLILMVCRNRPTPMTGRRCGSAWAFRKGPQILPPTGP